MLQNAENQQAVDGGGGGRANYFSRKNIEHVSFDQRITHTQKKLGANTITTSVVC